MRTLRQEVSEILGLHIADYGWADAFKAADIQGKMNNARIIKIVQALCERIDAEEQNKTAQST